MGKVTYITAEDLKIFDELEVLEKKVKELEDECTKQIAQGRSIDETRQLENESHKANKELKDFRVKHRDALIAKKLND